MTTDMLAKTPASDTNWKEIGISITIGLLTALVATVLAQTLIVPQINKAREKKTADKDKEPKK